PFAYPVPPATPLNHKLTTRPVPATGPYRITSASAGAVIERRNPLFRPWAGAAQPGGYPDELRWLLRVSDAAAVSAVEKGTADLLFNNPPPAKLRELTIDYSDQLHVNPAANTNFFFLNTTMPPFSNPAVRRAFNYAVDRRRAVAI